MINKKKIFQAGSLMIEMVAVIGLIALMTPMLFHQIHRRNEEILNTQIATEIRAVKDAFAAYIAANADTLAVPPGTGIKNEGCSWRKDLPIADFFTGDQSILGLYDYLVCVKWAPINTIDASNNSMPIVYGVVVQQIEDETNLRNAAKVASLIGLEGGVVMKNVINGIHDSWNLGMNEDDEDHISPNDSAVRVAAITSFSELGGTSLLTDVKWNHLRAETAHADKIFSTSELGTPGVFVVDASTNCILNIGNNDQGIEKDSCTFFKVDATTKDVVISAPIRTGIAGPGTTCSGITTKDACEKEAHCIWLSKPDASSGNLVAGCHSEYALNPSETSLMNDIKLTSAGGAKLSELLPNWILKDTQYINFGKDNYSKEITMPICPTGYSVAIMIIPTSFQAHAVSVKGLSSTTVEDRLFAEGAYRFAVKKVSTDASGDHEGIFKGGSEKKVYVEAQMWVPKGYPDYETAGKWVRADEYFEVIEETIAPDFVGIYQTYCFKP